MDTSVVLKSKSSGSQVWLEITYQGLRPPMDLFADLEMVGWKPPTVPPPPASAIDWSRPNTTTGQRFTLSDYVVEAAIAEPPKGSGSLGRWTSADRHAHLGVLKGILRRHGVDTSSGGQLAPAPPRIIEASAGSMVGTEEAASPQTQAPAMSDAPGAAPTSPPTMLPTGMVRLVAAVAPAAEAPTATGLANVGVRQITFSKVYRTITYRFRGSEAEQRVVDHLRLEVMVEADLADAARHALTQAAATLGLDAPPIEIDTAGPTGRSTDEGASLRVTA